MIKFVEQRTHKLFWRQTSRCAQLHSPTMARWALNF